MTMKKKLINLLLATALLPLTAQAQTITFETADYKAIGVYDTWEHSPFRTGELTGNVKVVDNPDTAIDDMLGTAPNASGLVLGFQRSRFGSNTYGARVDLSTTFELTVKTRYVHVMLHKPTAGRVMLIGLGKRQERQSQSPQTEQFWVNSTNPVEPDKWVDAVFPVKGAGGIDIHSLVIIPDNESPHLMAEDQVVYIDNITVNDDPTTTTQREPYPINFDRTQTYVKDDRGLTAIGLGEQRVVVASGITTQTPMYKFVTDQNLLAMPGQTLQPTFTYKGSWMHGYVYLDLGNDGKFTATIAADGKPAADSDLKAYSYITQPNDGTKGWNSAGQTLTSSGPNVLNPPSFTLPADLPCGFYRMRYKVDWDCLDAGGNTDPANTIVNNRGAVADIRLNVHGSQVTITDGQRNGDVLDASGHALGYKIPFGQPFTVKMRPENGFTYTGIRVRHGYNLQGDSLRHGTPQYMDVIIKKRFFADDDTYAIPAEYIDGDVMVEGLFVSVDAPQDEEYYPIGFERDKLNKHANRLFSGIGLNGQSLGFDSPKLGYHDMTARAFAAKAGNAVRPSVSYNGSWMQTYVYLDKNRNGYFDWQLPATQGMLAEDNDLMSFGGLTCADGTLYNSLGQQLSNLNHLDAPAFTLPAGLKKGYYMLRYKVDWDCADPEGNQSTDNHILNNGGGIADVRLFIHDGGQTAVHTACENGTLTTIDDRPLEGQQAAYGEPMTVKATPAEGFKLGAITLRHGDLTAADSLINGVAQYADHVFAPAEADRGLLDIDGSLVDGDLLLTAKFVPKEPGDADEDPYVLVFNDEFNQPDGSRPDPTRWQSPERGTAAWNRYVSNSPDVAYINDNALVLRAIPNPDTAADNVPMLTGGMESRNRFAFTYGRVDIRMKTTHHAGNFPAAWMMPQPPCAQWPNAGEIDIFETINNENTAYHTVHSHWTYDLGHKNDPQSGYHEQVSVEDWHVYSLEWNERLLTWYVDGRPVGTYAKSDDASAQSNGQWPFNAPFYLILNQSVGNGSWASNPDPGFTYESRVDYVRVFQPASLTGVTPPMADTAGAGQALYDLQGRRMEHPGTGIYIRDGKKVVIR